MIQPEIDRLLADGYELAQEGRVLTPFLSGAKLAFSERVEGFDSKLLGTFGPPDWRSQYENRLLDDDERWAHLRRLRKPG